ncbi:MAG: bifunctional 4-hydroxy-2-oxoglutarate aldolase/2-dehydro-3-deoxy-phosphogluconate aldolase [Pseudomonadota bacterium]
MTPEEQSAAARSICEAAPVVPVLVVNDAAIAAPLATALVAGGLPALEVTLRTPAALDVIREMAAVPGGFVGAGTLLNGRDVERAKEAGATFGVSPGATQDVIDAAMLNELPLLPGAATASEMMALLDRGYTLQKFFPAEAAGGAPALASFASPLPQITFCPTGGITPASAPTYLSLPNVICVGGSWVAPKGLVAEGDWAGIEALAQAAQTLRG